MRKFVTLAIVMVGVLTLAACSDEEADKAAQEAERVKLLDQFNTIQKSYMEMYDKVSLAAGKIIPIKNQIKGAQKSGDENLAAELQLQLESASGTWDALKDKHDAMENERADLMTRLRKLGHKFPTDR